MAGWLSSSNNPTSSVADEAAANLGPLNAPPDFLDGSIEATGEGVMRGGAMVARTAMLAGSVVPQALDLITAGDNFSGKSLTQQYFEALDPTITDAVDYWRSDDRTTGTAGRIVGGIAEFALPMMLSGGNPLATAAVTSANVTANTGADLANDGAAAVEAGGVAAVQGAANLIGFGIAMKGKTVLQRAAFGAGSNVAINMPADAASAAILDGADAAANYDPFSVESRAIDLVVGALFGAMAKGDMPRTADIDAAQTVHGVAHAQYDSAPGKLSGAAGARAQMDNMDAYRKAIVDGTDLPEPKRVDFSPDPVREQQKSHARQAFDEADGQLRMQFGEEPAQPRTRPPVFDAPLDAEADASAPLRKFVDENPDMPVAVVDDPDAPDGQARRITAREAFDELEAQRKTDDELSRGYEAAINCFLRGE